MNRFPSLLEYDLAAGARLGVRLVAGADEVGRACLAGPLVAAACLFDWEALTPAERDRFARLRDSKKLKPARCRELRPVITELAVCVAVCVVTPAEIDRDGLHVSNLRALRETVSHLDPAPGACFIDGYAVPACRYETTKLERGDETSAAVAAASIVAKATRDDLMDAVAAEHPDYGFNRHQGYITSKHNDAIRRLGITRHHRRSYNAAIYRELGLRHAAAPGPSVESDPQRALLAEMSDSFNRLELMVADLHPTDESDLAKAELVANLKGELASLRSRIEELKRALAG